MRKSIGRLRITAGIFMAFVTAWMIFSPTACALRTMPRVYRLSVGEQFSKEIGMAVLSSQDERLLSAVRPKVVVCCASSDRLYNSAHPDLLRLIRKGGAELWFSDCPPDPEGEPVPSHGLLRITVDDHGGLEAVYLPADRED